MPPQLQLQKFPGKVDGGWTKMSLRRFLADREFVGKMRFGASYSTSNKLLLIARHILIKGLRKCL